MATKKLVSPGVLTNEIDASFLPAAIGAIGAAVVGPASKGPVLIPTIISNTRELEATFGSTFDSGSRDTHRSDQNPTRCCTRSHAGGSGATEF